MVLTSARRADVAEETHSTEAQPRVWQYRYSRLLAAIDAFSILLSLGTAQLLRFGFPDVNSYRYLDYLGVSATIAVCWIAALAINNSRSHRIIGAGAEEYRRVWLGTIWVFSAVAIVSMLLKLEIARGYLLLALPLGLFLLLVGRWLIRKVIRRERQKYGHCVTRVLVVGPSPAAEELAGALAREPGSGYLVVGTWAPRAYTEQPRRIPGLRPMPRFGPSVSVADAVAATCSDAVAVAATEELNGGAGNGDSGIRQLSWELEKFDIDLLVAPGVVDVAGPRLHMRPVAGLPLIHVEKPQYHGAKRFQKRIFDIGFSSLVLLLGFPLLLTIAMAIKLSSKGPAFYRQERVGLGGKPFKLIKFRTMVQEADAMTPELLKLNLVASPRDPLKFVNDPRVTSIGRFLRKYSLDEIPQFINVLKRDMSVVGPRPQVASEVENYDDQARRRLLVRPGITGLWQISGRSDLSWDDSIRLDLYYVENWTMMADLVIAAKTARVIFSHTGAY